MKKVLRLSRKSKVSPDVPNASMSDIAFLLLIFFMVTTSFSVDKSPVNLPRTKYRTEIPKNHEVISIQRNGIIQFHGDRVIMADIQPLCAMELSKDKERLFLLKIDKDVNWAIVDELLEQMRLGRVRNLSLPTEQRIDS